MQALAAAAKAEAESSSVRAAKAEELREKLAGAQGHVTELKAQREALLTEIRHLKEDMQTATEQGVGRHCCRNPSHVKSHVKSLPCVSTMISAREQSTLCFIAFSEDVTTRSVHMQAQMPCKASCLPCFVA